MAARTEVEVIVNAQDNASSVLKNIGKSTSDLGSSVTSAFQKAALPSAAFAAALGLIAKAAIDSASEMEQNRVAFETMLGSAEKAGDLLKKLSDFARRTPFELPQVVTGAKQLLAYGSTAESVVDDFTILGNIAAGVGRDKLPELVLAFGQVRAKTRLAGQEMLQFTNAGVGLRDLLAKRLNIAIKDVDELMAAGKISFDDVRGALESTTKSGGKFFNLMSRQSTTFGGIVSNVSDNLGRMMRGFVGIDEAGRIREGSIFALLKRGAEGFLVVLNQLTPKVSALGDFLAKNRLAAFLLGGALIGILIPAFTLLIGTLIGAAIALAPFILLGAALGAVALVIAQNWGTIKPIIDSIMGVLTTIFNFFPQVAQLLVDKIMWLKDHWAEAIGFMIGYFLTLPIKLPFIMFDAMQKIISVITRIDWVGIFSVIVNAFKVIWEKIKSINWADLGIAIAKSIANGLAGMLEGALKGIFKGIPGGDKISGAIKIPRFQTGGIVPGPVGEPRLVVAHGGEEIKPNRSVEGSGAIFNVTLQVGTLIATETARRNFAEQIMKDLENIAAMKGKKISLT